ncbi:MAG: lytic transglycosylase domain-containing protein [Ferruginibacter sp.]
MKATLLKPVYFILLCVISAGIDASASVFNDTAKVSGRSGKTTTFIELKANVVYPVLLTGHESQSLEYIERFSVTKRAYLLRTFARGKKYFPKIASIFRKYNLPAELRVLIALESGFNAHAISPAGAVGYWQIMDDVAKEYGLKIVDKPPLEKTKFKVQPPVESPKKKVLTDERTNLNKSTYAAARYLRDRCKNLNNDYLLIVASYNWGVGNVWNAMLKTGMKSPTFWDIKKYLPAETKAYVMNFMALNVIFHNYEKFAKNQLTFKPVTLTLNDYSAFTGPLFVTPVMRAASSFSSTDR